MKKLFIALLLGLWLVRPCLATAPHGDAANDIIVTSNTNQFSSASTFSISCWLYVDSDFAGDDIFFGKMSGTNGDSVFYVNSDFGQVVFEEISTASNANSADNSIITNAWFHLVITRNSSSVINFYINNVDVSSDTSLTITNPSGACVFFGEDTTPAKEFKGAISEFAVWTSLLTAAEIGLLYNSRVRYMPLQIQKTNLVLYYPLDEVAETGSGNGLTFRDMTGLGSGAGTGALTGVTDPGLSYP